jgi:glyoxylase-like metal-dependent hydrolase (beta-lactamase superfamily II)
VVAVAPGVHWLRMPLPFALDHINLWLLRDGGGWLLVDCGYGGDTTREIWQTHRAALLGALPLTRILVTHCHPDHLGQAAWLMREHGCELLMTQGEYLSAHAMHGQTSGFGVAPLLELFSRHGMPAEEVEALRGRGNRYVVGVPEVPLRYQRVSDGDLLSIDGRDWRVIAGLGHSPEHAALYCKETGVLISGDMLLPKITTNVSVWPTEPDADPLGRFLASIERFREIPETTLVLPSHGLPFRGIAPRVQQLKAHHEARLAELLGAIGHEARTAGELRRVLFPRELDLQQLFFAMGETIAHLNHLLHLRRVVRRLHDGRHLFARN